MRVTFLLMLAACQSGTVTFEGVSVPKPKGGSCEGTERAVELDRVRSMSFLTMRAGERAIAVVCEGSGHEIVFEALRLEGTRVEPAARFADLPERGFAAPLGPAERFPGTVAGRAATEERQMLQLGNGILRRARGLQEGDVLYYVAASGLPGTMEEREGEITAWLDGVRFADLERR